METQAPPPEYRTAEEKQGNAPTESRRHWHSELTQDRVH